MKKLAACVLVTAPTFYIGGTTNVLMVTSRNFGGFCFPGGKVDKADHDNVRLLLVGEQVDDWDREAARCASRRELREETGLYATSLVWIASGPSSVEDDRFVHVFFARAVQGKVEQRENGTIPQWFEWMQWPKMVPRNADPKTDFTMIESPFNPFYRRHFPQGVDHFKPTIWLP